MYLKALNVLFLLGMIAKYRCEVSYEMRLESLEALKGQDYNVVELGGLKLLGRERAINGTVILKEDLTDEFTVSLRTFAFKDGDWSPLLYGSDGLTTCEFFKTFFIKYFVPASQITNLPRNSADYCPLRKGEFWIINAVPNTERWVSFVRRGLNKIQIELLQRGKPVGGIICVASFFDRNF